MYLKEQKSGDAVEVLSLGDLFDPFRSQIVGRFHKGEEIQEADSFPKQDLVFPSGEALPQCWVNPQYRS